MTGRIEEWRNERRLSTVRAGASGRAFVSERLWAFVRPNAVRLVITSVVGISFGALVFLLPGRFDAVKSFAFGGWTVLVLMYAYHWCMIASGASQSMMGEQGEIRTDQELRSLRKRGWRVVNHLTLKHGDIDHIAIGPDGLMVIESKWTSSPMRLDGTDRWVDGWADQTKRNTDDVRRFIGWGARADAPIAPLLVVWGPQITPPSDEFHRMPNGVNVIAGRHLRQALGDLADDVTDAGEIEKAYLKLAKHAETRDRADLERRGPRPRRPSQLINEGMLLIVTGFASFYAAVSVARLPPWAWAVGAVAIAALGVAAVRKERLRRVAIAWLTGFGAAVALVVALVVSQLA